MTADDLAQQARQAQATGAARAAEGNAQLRQILDAVQKANSPEVLAGMLARSLAAAGRHDDLKALRDIFDADLTD